MMIDDDDDPVAFLRFFVCIITQICCLETLRMCAKERLLLLIDQYYGSFDIISLVRSRLFLTLDGDLI